MKADSPSKTPPRRGRGRPKTGNAREMVWPIRFSEREVKKIKAAAKGKPSMQWIRETLMAAAA